MRRMHLYISLLVLLMFPTEVLAITKNKPLTRIPFELVGSYIVLTVAINDATKLNLLLDTGIGATLITELSAKDSVLLNVSEQTTLKGLGPGNDLFAWKSKNNNLRVGKLKLSNQTIYVLTDDIFNLTKHTGYPIQGILGTDLFENHQIWINYSTKTLKIFNDSTFVPPSDFTRIPLYLEGTKMFVDVHIEDANGQNRTVRMLLDTGAELAAWFRSQGSNSIPIPQKNIKSFIGKGLNGNIEGTYARMPKIELGGHILEQAVVSFPDSASIAHAFSTAQRDGTIGSQILSRFELIFDQKENALYVRPNYKLKKKFTYNMAGIEVIQAQEVLSLPEIYHVRKGSPGDVAGVLPGDLILEINGESGLKIKLNQVKHYFETPHKSLSLVLLRNSKTISLRIPIKSEL